MVTKFNSSFEKAEDILKNALSKNNLSFGAYNARLSNPCIVKHYNICNVGKDVDDDANVTITILYTITEPNSAGILASYDKERQLNFLSTAGDIFWSDNMISKVWNGEYPSTVCYDNDSGEVFFAYIRYWGIEFKYFATLSKEQLNAMEELNLERPYFVHIEPEAMFRVLDGSEGTNHLKQNIYIEFDCVHPIKLNADTTVERVY